MRRPTPLPAGPGQESVWDYPRPPRVEAEPRPIEIILGGELIVSTSRAWRVLETSHPPVYYIPRQDVTPGALELESGASSFCEWKGPQGALKPCVGRRVSLTLPNCAAR